MRRNFSGLLQQETDLEQVIQWILKFEFDLGQFIHWLSYPQLNKFQIRLLANSVPPTY